MNKEKKNLLVFGYGLSIISLFICWRITVKHGWSFICWILIAGSLTALAMTLFRQDILKEFYKRWMKVAHGIGAIVTNVILSVIYYCIFGVVGIVLRIMGKDIMNQKLNTQVKSYWLARENPTFDKSHYKRQF